MVESPTPTSVLQPEHIICESGSDYIALRLPTGILLALPYYQQGVTLSAYERRVINVLSIPYGECLIRGAINRKVVLPIGRLGKYGPLWKAVGNVVLTKSREPVFVLHY